MRRHVCRALLPVMVKDGTLVVETHVWPLLHLDGRSNGPDSINRLVMSSPLTDPVDHCSSVFLLLSDGELRNSGVVVMTLRGGKEGIVDHPAWHLEFLRDLAEVTGKNRTIITFFPK